MKNTHLALLSALAVTGFSQSSLAGTSENTQILSIQAQDNRTWIKVFPPIGDATACSYKDGVEITDSTANGELILSLASAAMMSDSTVRWITTDNCSNVDRDLVRGIVIYQ